MISPAQAHPAIVSRSKDRGADPDRYLALSAAGAPVWTEDLAAATTFGSMREATRAALRLPGALRAYSIPLGPELALVRLH